MKITVSKDALLREVQAALMETVKKVAEEQGLVYDPPRDCIFDAQRTIEASDMVCGVAVELTFIRLDVSNPDFLRRTFDFGSALEAAGIQVTIELGFGSGDLNRLLHDVLEDDTLQIDLRASIAKVHEAARAFENSLRIKPEGDDEQTG